MSYICYLGATEMPTPSKLSTKIKGKNETLTLLDEGEVNFIKTTGLTELVVNFDFTTVNGDAERYMGVLEELKVSDQPTQFILVRQSPDYHTLYDTNMRVTVESYTLTEDASQGLDVSVEVNLKQWRDYGTQTVEVQETDSGTQAIVTDTERDASTAPSTSSYTVVSGDSLWAIAKKYYGDGSRWQEIYDANSDIISNPNLIYPGQELVIP